MRTGIVTVCTAAVTNEAGLLANRVALGITEAGVIQTVLYYMSQFYGPERLAMSFSKSMGVGGSVAKTLGPLLAGGYERTPLSLIAPFVAMRQRFLFALPTSSSN